MIHYDTILILKNLCKELIICATNGFFQSIIMENLEICNKNRFLRAKHNLVAKFFECLIDKLNLFEKKRGKIRINVIKLI